MISLCSAATSAGWLRGGIAGFDTAAFPSFDSVKKVAEVISTATSKESDGCERRNAVAQGCVGWRTPVIVGCNRSPSL